MEPVVWVFVVVLAAGGVVLWLRRRHPGGWRYALSTEYAGQRRDLDAAPVQRQPDPARGPVAPPLAASPAYQQPRQQMRTRAQARHAARDEEADDREEILRQYYNRLREPASAHRPAVDEQATAEAVHARQSLARHRVARGSAVPLRNARHPELAPGRGAA